MTIPYLSTFSSFLRWSAVALILSATTAAMTYSFMQHRSSDILGSIRKEPKIAEQEAPELKPVDQKATEPKATEPKTTEPMTTELKKHRAKKAQSQESTESDNTKPEIAGSVNAGSSDLVFSQSTSLLSPRSRQNETSPPVQGMSVRCFIRRYRDGTGA